MAAAADLQFALPEISARFQENTGRSVKLTFGSSGNFFAQIQNGAPFDIFLSADSDYPKKLETAGLTEPGTLFRYATGKIVLWIPNGSKLDLSRGLAVLLDPSIHKIAVANPLHAPYGRAAVAAMQHEKVYDQVAGKFVLGENIAQTATFVATGNAEAGIIALSLALSPAMGANGRYVAVPEQDYPTLEQSAVILKSSAQKATARQFLDFLRAPAAQEILKSYGFGVTLEPRAAP